MRVVIGEDQALMRAGLSLVLERAGFEIVAIAADAEDVVRKTAAHRPDLLVTDIRMPPTHTDDGLRAALEARTRLPGLPVLVLSQYLQRDYAVELLESGDEGVGYLLKQRIADVERFVADLRRIAGGGTVLDPAVVATMVDRHRAEEDPVARLTDRQREVLELMAQGRSNAAIAAQLGVSEKAIVRHTSRIYDELGLPSSAQDHRRVLAVVRFLSS
ncbi:MAG TPA: response regulator transcription factor [Solirubrobacterales bacterium]|nr:response regulator transcription factor [Solirubrobacterales bacterium]